MLLLKEFSHLLPDMLTVESSGLSAEDIRKALFDVSQELPVIYPEFFENTAPEEIDALLRELDVETIAQGVFRAFREEGEKFLRNITPFAVEPLLYSAKHKLTGAPNKIIKIDEALAPSIVRLGKPPERGVWQRERLLLAAYALLIEEHYDTVVSRGFVEYLRYGVFREVVIRHRERRGVLQILRKIQKIYRSQVMPEMPDNAPCDTCRYDKVCRLTPDTLASKFF
jgi:CRISPR/Cas system-associated exonuclease Cas4 (RecB family)